MNLLLAFSSCSFEEGMVISPLNTIPKSSPNEHRVILVDDFISKVQFVFYISKIFAKLKDKLVFVLPTII
jgi:hypothetical protein